MFIVLYILFNIHSCASRFVIGIFFKKYLFPIFRPSKPKDIAPAKIKYEVVDYNSGKSSVVKAENIRYINIFFMLRCIQCGLIYSLYSYLFINF